MRAILDHLGVHYELLDADLMLSVNDRDFWSFLGGTIPTGKIELTDALPELVGLEAGIAEIQATGKGVIKVPAIRRNDRYCHLSVIPISEAESDRLGSRVLVLLADATDEMEKHRQMIQKKNEIDLLSRTLEFRNAELATANIRLDRLMEAIRTQNHDLNIMVKNATKELHDSRLSVIMMLANVAEFRDTDTGDHIYRIGRISAIMARRLGLSPADRETIFYASLLHDVGKVGIPDSILLKRNQLSDSEMILMRDHTRIGADLFKRHKHRLFTDIHDVVLYHHEHWDGTGYPCGLSGDKIPLGARICAVADVFDALVSRRPYKEPWDFELAVSYIKDKSGKYFDPDIVKVFLVSLDEIRNLSDNTIEDLDDLEATFA